jgi:hypothetical protein
MEIINPLDQPDRDIKTPLHHLASSPDPGRALRGRLLLELAQYLEENSGPRLLAHTFLEQLHFSAFGRGAGIMEVGVDWPDYGPFENGLPVAHYRIRVKREGVPISDELRTADVEQVRQFILQTFTEG